MKIITSQIAFFLKQREVRGNLLVLSRIILMIVSLIIFYSVLFHIIMMHEGQHYSWITGFYWTLTVMSTLGFGDITFTSDAGKLFTIIVLVSGVVFLLIILPFTFVQYFYTPWIKAQREVRTPRSVPPDTKGHVIVVSTSPIALNLVDELREYGARCVILCTESSKALDLLDQGYEVIAGEHDSTATYENLRITFAAMLVALDSDVRNTNIVFTARSVCENVPIIASAQSEDAIDILELAGSSHVFRFPKLLGEALARRILNASQRFSIISQYNELVVAEGPVMRTDLVGKTLRNSNIRSETGANVVGIWDRGKFELPMADTEFTETMVIVIVGDEKQIMAANKFLGTGVKNSDADGPVLIIGCGRVGMAAAKLLELNGQTFMVVDKEPKSGFEKGNLVIGDAADIAVLQKAGIYKAPTVIITTHDDDTNIYLTIYCRRLRPDIQIISRATLDRNVEVLHAAGADLVLSLASMVSSTIINLLAPGKVLMINEGLNIFRSPVGKDLVGKPLMGSGIRTATHCSVVAIKNLEGIVRANPDPHHIFEEGEELYLIGDSKAEKAYYEKFGKNTTITS